MKKIKASKKLRLNKHTVRALSADQTRQVNGGSVLICTGWVCAPRFTGNPHLCVNRSAIIQGC